MSRSKDGERISGRGTPILLPIMIGGMVGVVVAAVMAWHIASLTPALLYLGSGFVAGGIAGLLIMWCRAGDHILAHAELPEADSGWEPTTREMVALEALEAQICGEDPFLCQALERVHLPWWRRFALDHFGFCARLRVRLVKLVAPLRWLGRKFDQAMLGIYQSLPSGVMVFIVPMWGWAIPSSGGDLASTQTKETPRDGKSNL